MKQMTAVELLVERINKRIDLTTLKYWNEISILVSEAKEMEKEQIIEAYCQGCFDIINQDDIFPRETSEQYYNETFKSNEK